MNEWPTTQPTSEQPHQTSPARMPYTWRSAYSSATAWPPLSRTMPLGFPVVPEVYMMYSGSAAFTGTGAAGSLPVTSARQSLKPVPVRSAGPASRCSTSTASTRCAACSRAPLTSGM